MLTPDLLTLKAHISSTVLHRHGYKITLKSAEYQKFLSKENFLLKMQSIKVSKALILKSLYNFPCKINLFKKYLEIKI